MRKVLFLIAIFALCTSCVFANWDYINADSASWTGQLVGTLNSMPDDSLFADVTVTMQKIDADSWQWTYTIQPSEGYLDSNLGSTTIAFGTSVDAILDYSTLDYDTSIFSSDFNIGHSIMLIATEDIVMTTNYSISFISSFAPESGTMGSMASSGTGNDQSDSYYFSGDVPMPLFQDSPAEVPEPATFAYGIMGLVSLVGIKKRFTK